MGLLPYVEGSSLKPKFNLYSYNISLEISVSAWLTDQTVIKGNATVGRQWEACSEDELASTSNAVVHESKS
jgi:hypothetical protein